MPAIARRALSSFKLIVSCADVAVLQAFAPEVVVCDLGLPDLDGCDVAHAFRTDERLRSVALIALTGYATQADRQRAIEAGFDDHLAKPPDIERLSALLGEWAGRRVDSALPSAAGPASGDVQSSPRGE